MGNQSLNKSANRNQCSVIRTRSVLNMMLIALSVFTFSCSPNNNGNDGVDTTPKTPPVPRVAAPAFSADSAYAYIKAQVDFGPRVPGSKEHTACAQYIQDKLKSFSLTVTVQKSPATLFNGTKVEMQNITGAYKPERTERVLLVAHWDTRLMADRDTGRVNEPIDGANDGGSGVGVLALGYRARYLTRRHRIWRKIGRWVGETIARVHRALWRIHQREIGQGHLTGVGHHISPCDRAAHQQLRPRAGRHIHPVRIFRHHHVRSKQAHPKAKTVVIVARIVYGKWHSHHTARQLPIRIPNIRNPIVAGNACGVGQSHGIGRQSILSGRDLNGIGCIGRQSNKIIFARSIGSRGRNHRS